MAKVKIKIEVNPNADDEELGNIQNQVNNTPSLENVSNVSVKIRGDGIYEEIPSNYGGINGLSLGYALVFDENGYLDNADLEGGVLESTENPVEFVWGVVPENGEYTVRLTFTDAQSLKDITIFGDSEVNQFPTRAIIDGYKEITNDDLTWYINFGNEASTHTIEFTHWNKVNYNACLSKIGITLQYIEIDKTSGLKSVDSTSQSSTDTTEIFYGTVENRGSLEILDKTGELVDMLKDGIIDNSNTKLEIVANNETIQTHISTDSTYNANSQVMSLDLGNRLSSLDILKYKGYDYPDHSERLSVLFFDVLSNLRYALFGKDKELTEEEFKEMLSAKYDSTKTLYDYLYSIKVQYPVIEANKTYREVIDEFCLIAQMQMYIDDNDNVSFVSARPVYFEENLPAINIPKKNMFSQLDYSVVLKNKYDGVEASKTKVNNNIDIETTLYTWKSEDEEYEETNTSDADESTTNSLGISIYNYVRVTAKYYSSTLKFKKQSDDNLEKILSVLDGVDLSGNPRIKYNVNYTQKTGGVTVSSLAGSNQYWFNPNYTSSIDSSGSLATYGQISDSVGNITASVKDETNLKDVKITSDDEYYYATFKILVGLTKIHGSYTISTGTTSGFAESYTPNSVELSIYGNKRIISFEQVQSNTSNIETAKTKVSLNSSNLIQSDYIVDTIKNNILNDYKNGVSNATVSISCNDYFDENGEKAIDWAKGEIPKVNQILYFNNDLYADGNQRYWKIKGRTFRKTGVPMVDLELEESRLSLYNETEYGLFDEENNQLKTWKNLIDEALVQIEDKSILKASKVLNGKLKVPLMIEQINDYAFEGCTQLTDINIPSVTNIGNSAFEGCTSLSKVNLINVNTIGYSAFNNCASLISINIPKTIQLIGNTAFRGCSSLKLIDLSKCNITRLNYRTFAGCYNLKYVLLPTTGTLTYIAEQVFYGCDSLEHIFIPSSVTSMETGIVDEQPTIRPFFECNSSTIVYCESTSAQSGWGEEWNAYNYLFENSVLTYYNLKTKYNYTFEQYKSEVGIK